LVVFNSINWKLIVDVDFGALHFCGIKIANFAVAQKLAFSAYLTWSNI